MTCLVVVQPSVQTVQLILSEMPYQKLTLECSLSRRTVEQHKTDIVPEARRKGKPSKRRECKFQVTFSWPKESMTPCISSLGENHNHDVYPDINEMYLLKC